MMVLYREAISGFCDDIEEIINDRCKYYASDLVGFLDLDENSFNEALQKAEKGLNTLHFPLRHNIRSVYRATTEGLTRDIKLSALAAYFFSIHIDPSNPMAAKLQYYFASRYGFNY